MVSSVTSFTDMLSIVAETFVIPNFLFTSKVVEADVISKVCVPFVVISISVPPPITTEIIPKISDTSKVIL